MNVLEYEQSDLLEIAMVLQNMKDELSKQPLSKLKSKYAEITLKADFRNIKNEYYDTLWRNLDYIDYEEGNEVSGNNVDVRFIEERVFETLTKEKVITELKTDFEKVPDPVGFGIWEDQSTAYHIKLDLSVFDEAYLDVTDAIEVEGTLDFINFSNPVLTVKGKKYVFGTMRGNALEIITHCWENYPNEIVSLEVLLKELKISGVTNLNEAIKNSFFDKRTGLLRQFAQSMSKTILVKKTASLPKRQVEAIALATQKNRI